MYRALMLGLLGAVGSVASGLVGLAHGGITWMALIVAALAAGVGTCLAAQKKCS
jgi:hypothetical protein